MSSNGMLVEYESQSVALISLGAEADALVQQLDRAEPAERMVFSATGVAQVGCEPLLQACAQQPLLGAVLCVVAQGDAQALPLLAQLRAALGSKQVPLLVAVCGHQVSGHSAAQWQRALRAACDGVLLLQAPPQGDVQQSMLVPLQQFEMLLRHALSTEDTGMNVFAADIVECMAGQHSQICVKADSEALQPWFDAVLAQCRQSNASTQALGVFHEVPRNKSLSTTRSLRDNVVQSLPDLEALQMHPWWAHPTRARMQSLVIYS